MKPFIPELNQEYFYINLYGGISSTSFINDEADEYLIQTGNCFPTLEAAEYHRRMQTKAWEIRQKSFEPDWSDQSQPKISAAYSYEYKEMYFACTYSREFRRIYFSEEETAREAFDGVSNDDFLYMQRNGMV